MYVLSGNELRTLHHGDGLKGMCFINDHITLATEQGYYEIDAVSGSTVLPLQTKLPVVNIGCVTAINNNLWAGTDNGAYMRSARGSFHYYASKRWLDNDSVISIAADSIPAALPASGQR